MKPKQNLTQSRRAAEKWKKEFEQGKWVFGWIIKDPDGEYERSSFARTRRAAWDKFCAPAMDPNRAVKRLQADGFKAHRKRARRILG